MTKKEFDSDKSIKNYLCDLCGYTSYMYGWSNRLQIVLCHSCYRKEGILMFQEKNNKMFHVPLK